MGNKDKVRIPANCTVCSWIGWWEMCMEGLCPVCEHPIEKTIYEDSPGVISKEIRLSTEHTHSLIQLVTWFKRLIKIGGNMPTNELTPEYCDMLLEALGDTQVDMRKINREPGEGLEAVLEAKAAIDNTCPHCGLLFKAPREGSVVRAIGICKCKVKEGVA